MGVVFGLLAFVLNLLLLGTYVGDIAYVLAFPVGLVIGIIVAKGLSLKIIKNLFLKLQPY